MLRPLAAVLAGCGGGGGGRRPERRSRGGRAATTITQAAVRRAARAGEAELRDAEAEVPEAGTPEYETLKNQAVQYLVQRAEFEQEADKLGVKVSDEEVDKRLEQIKKQYFGGSETRYKKQLKQQGLTEEQVKDDIRRS